MNVKEYITGFAEVGGLGKIKYHNIYFSKYEVEMRGCEKLIVPIVDAENPVSINKENSLTVKELLLELCNLYNELEKLPSITAVEKAAMDFIIQNGHPYNIDEVYEDIKEECFEHTLIRDATFSLNNFLHDLSKLGKAFNFFHALDSLHSGDYTYAMDLYREGDVLNDNNLFEQYPFFERYKYVDPWTEKEQRKDYKKMEKLLPTLEEDIPFEPIQPLNFTGDVAEDEKLKIKYFKKNVIKDTDNLLDTLIDLFPDFTMRLKKDPATNEIRIVVDVNSIFEISWLAFAKIVDEDSNSEIEREFEDDDDYDPYDIYPKFKGYFCCLNCKKYFPKTTNGKQRYCSAPECKKAHANARSKKSYYNRMLKQQLKEK